MTRDLVESLELLSRLLEHRKAEPLGTIKKWRNRVWTKGVSGWRPMSNTISRALVSESLSSAVDYKWVKSDRAVFSIEDATNGTIPYVIHFKARNITHPKYGRISGYQVEFFQKADEELPWKYQLSATGHAFTILATVQKALAEFLLKQKPDYVWFVADEDSRMRLYDRLVSKMKLDGYAAERTDEGKYTIRRLK